MNVVTKILLFAFVALVRGKFQIIPEEDIVSCTKSGKANFIDVSGIHYDAVNDTLFYINGDKVFEKKTNLNQTLTFQEM